MDARSAGWSYSPYCDTVFERPYRSSFWLRDSRGCSSTNPVEDICRMEPPSSNAEALRDEQAAQVRAANGLLVAADEFRHFERGHQPVRQSIVRRRRGD